jgi:hypothetical protein
MRLNAGIPPSVLSDQHLRAERRELLIPFGTIRKMLSRNPTYFPKTVPDEFCLNTGHINFFIPKLLYVIRRLEVINEECLRRGFEHTMNVSMVDIPQRFISDWESTNRDALIVKDRIVDRLKNPLNASSNYHKYFGKPIYDMNCFCENILTSKLSV